MVIARRLRVSEDDVIQMNRRLGGDASLNAPMGDHSDSGDWQDWLVDDAPSQERVLIETEELDNRRSALREALVVLDDRERRIFEARHLADEPITLEDGRGFRHLPRACAPDRGAHLRETTAFRPASGCRHGGVASTDRGPASAIRSRPETAEDDWIDEISPRAPFGCFIGYRSSMRAFQWTRTRPLRATLEIAPHWSVPRCRAH